MIYLDNGATTFPKPQSVLRAVNEAMSLYGANPGRGGHAMTMKAGRRVYETRQALADMFSCGSDRVAFCDNCTSALNTAIRGCLKKGDHVIISSLEHNSVLRPVHAMKKEGLITYDVFFVEPCSKEKTLSNLKALIKKNTAAVICTAVSNVFGTVLPVAEIGALLEGRGILFIVDGAQAAGSHRLNMSEDKIDILCLPGHKGLMGPMGTGLLLFNERAEPLPLKYGGTGSGSMSPDQPDFYPDRLESGTVNLPGIAGLGAGVSFIRSRGLEAISQSESELISVLREDLSVIKGAEVYSLMHSTPRTNLLSFNIKGKHSEQVAELADKRGIALRAGYHCSYLAHKSYGTEKNGTVRVSVGPFNTKKDIKNLAFYLNKIALCKNM